VTVGLSAPEGDTRVRNIMTLSFNTIHKVVDEYGELMERYFIGTPTNAHT